jgi:CRP-like cAMP-binding protein
MAIFNLTLLPMHVVHPNLFRRGDFLPLKSDLLWKLDSGFVRTIGCDEAGEITTLGIWGTGDIVGRSLSHIETYQIECLTAVQAIPERLGSQDLQGAMTLYIQQVEELLSLMHCKQVSLRLLKLLNFLAHKFGCKTDQGWLIDLRLTHQILAEMIGTTRVTITRLINQFEREGKLVRLNHHRLVLRDS